MNGTRRLGLSVDLAQFSLCVCLCLSMFVYVCLCVLAQRATLQGGRDNPAK